MRYLITGGAGFIGSHLAERLLRSGAEVTVLDDLSTGRIVNLADVLAHPRLWFEEGSILEPAPLTELVAEADVVFHLAAAVGVRLVLDEPVKTLETNVQGTRLVLEAAARARATRGRRRHGPKLVLASSSEVYGHGADVPFREDGPLLVGRTDAPRWAYACSKAMGESLVRAHVDEHRLDALSVRFFNVVGARQRGRYGMVLPNFVRQALAGEPVTVFGDGLQSRTFLHVDDAVRALDLLAQLPRGEGEAYNVGGIEEVAIGDLARRVVARTHSASRIVRMPYREAYGTRVDDLMRRVPDIRRLVSRTGFRPARSLSEAIDDVAAARRDETRLSPRG